MISLLEPLPVGNAIRIFYSPPVAALAWRILRKDADTFTAYNDPAASVVAHEGTGNVQLDITGLVNGTPYFYKPYWFNGTAWTAEATVSATPATSFTDNGVDTLLLMRDRLEDGFKALIAASRITTGATAIRVLTAPPLFDDVAWPVVTVHCNQDDSATRAIGEVISPDAFDAVAEEWESGEGWLSAVSLSIVIWSLNPDERASLRHALKTIILANLPVFYDVGLTQIEFRQSDTADFQSYNVPVYQVMNTFSCQAPAIVSSRGGNLQDILVSIVY